MTLSSYTQSLPVVTYTKDLTKVKFGAISKWKLYDNFTVKYEWYCPEKGNSRKQEMKFENLPLQIQVMIAKKAITTSLLKILEPHKQLILMNLAVQNN